MYRPKKLKEYSGFVYYNNTNAADAQNANGVWDANFEGVWHLNEGYSTAPDFYQDSAGTQHGTLTDANTSSAAAAGKIGDAFDFENGGAQPADAIRIANFSQHFTNQITFSGWVKSPVLMTAMPLSWAHTYRVSRFMCLLVARE